MCSLQMISFSVLHVHRAANSVAHKLAKLATSQLLDEVWIDDCPVVIRDVYLLSKLFLFNQ